MEPLPDHTIQFSGLKEGQHQFTFELGDAFFAATGMATPTCPATTATPPCASR